VEGRPLEPVADDELIERAKRGDVRAYELLVERYRGVAVRAAYLACRSTADAEDAAQEAFVKAYGALGRFEQGRPFRPWILRIVTNEATNRRRSARRREDLALRVSRDRPSGEAAPSPEEAVLASERDREVLSAMSALKEDDRLVIAYRYFLELSEAEMAEALGVRPGTVKSRLHRAMERLRVILAPSFPSPSEEGAVDG
jgi:RNA polymerase sigma-70 factor (ECF subfamily)